MKQRRQLSKMKAYLDPQMRQEKISQSSEVILLTTRPRSHICNKIIRFEYPEKWYSFISMKY